MELLLQSASGGPCSALGQEKVAIRTKQENLQPLSTAVFSVNIVLLEWWLDPHCRGEKSISWDSLRQCLNLFIYLQKRCYPDSSVSLCIFTQTNLFTLGFFFFLNQGATVAILELSNKPQEPRTELRGMAPPFETRDLCCGHQPECSRYRHSCLMAG